jgi:DNA-binding response OmpR family regulator
MSVTNTILVVDDEPNLRATLACILQDEGYVVTTAANAQEALQYLQAGAYDLAFFDVKMPEVSGLALLSDVRALYPKMPVLILTAHASLDSAIEALRNSADDYLFKPIDPPQILNRVRQLLFAQHKPKRRREIFNEMKELMSELDRIDQPSKVVVGHFVGVTAVDPARFLQRGPISLDLHTRQVTVGGALLNLTPTAFDYLVTLVRHSPDTVSCETLVMESQGYKLVRVEANDLCRQRVHELRKALERDSRQPHYIITVRGTGYRLVT